VGGVEPQTETVWRQADRYGVPRIIFVNKMDRVGADFDMCLKMVRERLGTKAVPIQLPLGSGELFTGTHRSGARIEIVYDDETMGKKYVEGPVPEAMKEQVAKLRHEMIEACVESDDAILHKYLEDHKLTEEEIRTVIRKATITGHVVPSSAAPHSRTKVFRRCSMLWWTTCRHRRTSRRSRAICRTTTRRTPSARPPMTRRSRLSRSRS